MVVQDQLVDGLIIEAGMALVTVKQGIAQLMVDNDSLRGWRSEDVVDVASLELAITRLRQVRLAVKRGEMAFAQAALEELVDLAASIEQDWPHWPCSATWNRDLREVLINGQRLLKQVLRTVEQWVATEDCLRVE